MVRIRLRPGSVGTIRRPTRLPREIRVVGIDIEPEQRQPKALLPGPRAVARARVAALLATAPTRRDCESSTETAGPLRHDDLCRRRLLAEDGGDRRLTVADRNGDALFDLHDLVIAGLELDVGQRDLLLKLLARLPLDDQRLPGFGRRQRDDAGQQHRPAVGCRGLMRSRKCKDACGQQERR